ncbi:tyrosine-type recombinase/integrase [Nocardioides zeae]
MASVQKRVNRAGKATYAVLYRHGGRQTSKTFATSADANRFKKLVDAAGPERAVAMLTESSAPAGITTTELFEKWIAWKTDRGDVTDRTVKDYRRDWRNWADPWLGHREAALVDEGDVQRWVDHMATKLNPKTVGDRHALLFALYDWASARSRRLVPHNPCLETELPRKKKRVVRGLSLPEWHRLETAMRAIDADAADFVLFLASTGWRFSEATALPAGAVEDDGTRVYVTLRQVARVGATGSAIVPDEGKSQAALRRIRLFGDAVPMIRRRVEHLGPEDLVLTTARGNRWRAGAFRDRKWLRAVEAAGLTSRGPTPHWLRHTHVALCVAAGMKLPEIQRRLGHESIQTTINVYGGMIDDMDDATADRLDLLLSGRSVVLGSVE